MPVTLVLTRKFQCRESLGKRRQLKKKWKVQRGEGKRYWADKIGEWNSSRGTRRGHLYGRYNMRCLKSVFVAVVSIWQRRSARRTIDFHCGSTYSPPLEPHSSRPARLEAQHTFIQSILTLYGFFPYFSRLRPDFGNFRSWPRSWLQRRRQRALAVG